MRMTPFLSHFYTQTDQFTKDGLGTNVGKKAFFAGEKVSDVIGLDGKDESSEKQKGQGQGQDDGDGGSVDNPIQQQNECALPTSPARAPTQLCICVCQSPPALCTAHLPSIQALVATAPVWRCFLLIAECIAVDAVALFWGFAARWSRSTSERARLSKPKGSSRVLLMIA